MTRTPTFLRTEDHNGVAVVVLSRADKRNALTPDMIFGLDTLLKETIAASRAVVLAGDGNVFCGGFDLKLCHTDQGTLESLLIGLARVIETLRASDKPVVIAAHGAAIAGGCALLGGADVVVTDRVASLGYPVVTLGISPAVSAPYLAQRVGNGAARELLLGAGLITGEEARRIGLADVCCDIREDVVPRSLRIAGVLASKPVEAFAATKTLLREIEDLSGVLHRATALKTSLRLTDSDEQRTRLAAMWGVPANTKT
ncbi:MAG: enoyl-CoA hydratase/isomerase family protein [Phycisphaerales bacterium]|nr:enoyl-CoA hydratase/isomerase family protein [Phycisphaerales bacterium]